MTIAVVMPSRGRPEQANEAVKSFYDTRRHDSQIYIAADATDSRLLDYGIQTRTPVYETIGTMVARTNDLALSLPEDIIGWCADDNRFRTLGWDCDVQRAFDKGALMVNTNDLLVGNEKGGVFFARADVIHALGYFLLPSQEHLYVDYAFTELGKAAGVLTYLGYTIIEHLHPYANKAQWDNNYRAVNNPLQDEIDRNAFEKWRREGFERDVEVVKRCLVKT